MPFGDGTGPQGLGLRTGRGAGYCAGFGVAGSMNPVFAGRGFGCGRAIGCAWFSGGRGWRNWYRTTGSPRWARTGYRHPFAPSFTAKDEMSLLREEAEFLRKQMEEIQSRIHTLEKTEAQEG